MQTDATFEEIAQLLDAFLNPDQDEKQTQKRKRILFAAMDSFIAHGYRKTSVEDIAHAAGVAKGTVYLYYRNKAELLFHAIAMEKQRYVSKLVSLGNASLSPLDRLRAFIVSSVILIGEMPLVTRLIGGDHEIDLVMQDVDGEVLERVNEQQVAVTAKLIEGAVDQHWPHSEFQRRAKVLIDLIYAVVTGGHMIKNQIPLEEYAYLLADIVVEGLIRKPEGWVPFEFDVA